MFDIMPQHVSNSSLADTPTNSARPLPFSALVDIVVAAKIYFDDLPKYFISAYCDFIKTFSPLSHCVSLINIARAFRLASKHMWELSDIYIFISDLITCAIKFRAGRAWAVRAATSVFPFHPRFPLFIFFYRYRLRSQTRNNARDEMFLMPLTSWMPWVKMIRMA